MAVPTSADVARRAGVSRATVSYVLNNVTNQTISPKTRSSVQSAAKELGYRPNLAARSLAVGTSAVLILVIPQVHLGELALKVASRLTSALSRQGMVLVVHFDTGLSSDLEETARNVHPRAVLGLFDLPEDPNGVLEQAGIQRQAPRIVDLGQHIGQTQIEHLRQLGHVNIAFADSDDPGLAQFRTSRRHGVQEACRRLGLREPLYGSVAVEGRGIDDAAALVRAWYTTGVTAVAAYNDEVALAVTRALVQVDLVYPKNISVIGVDDAVFAALVTPALTTIAFDSGTLAEAYTTELMAIVRGLDADHQTVQDFRDGVHLIARASTAPPNPV